MMNIGIAGAGLMGRLLAWKLSNLGFSVTLFDQEITGCKSAAYIAAGLISPYAEVNSHPSVLQLGIQSIPLWKKIASEFDDQSWFKQNGSLIITHREDKNKFNFFIRKIKQANPPSGVTPLTSENILALEPEIQCTQAILLSDEALIDTRKLLKLLICTTQNNNPIKMHNKKIHSVNPYKIITDHQQAYQFDLVFDCRGMGGDEHFQELRGVRGEIIIVQAKEVNISRPIYLLHPHYRLYIAPRSASLYVIGASEIEAHDTSPMSVRTCLELLTAAYSIHRGFAEARILELNTGLRPALNNNLPQIKYFEGLIAVNGLYRYGYLLAPVLLEEIVQHLQNQFSITENHYVDLC